MNRFEEKIRKFVYCLRWVFLILEFVVCAQIRACMPDRLPEVTNVILV